MKTYYIEDENNEIIGYYKTLNDAKYSLQKFLKTGYSENSVRIVMIQGQYFGEGFHKYYLMFLDGKYKKFK